MKVFGKIATALLLLVYVTAFAGFRLHECSVDRTVEVLPLLAGDTCEEVHHHHCSDAAHCGHHHHHCAEDHEAQDADATGLQLSEADCCANSVHYLSDAQINSDTNDDDVAQKCLTASFATVVCDTNVSMIEGFEPAFCQARCPVAGRNALVLYSVRRV